VTAAREKGSLKRRQKVASRPGRRRRRVLLGLAVLAAATLIGAACLGVVALWRSAQAFSSLALVPADEYARRAIVQLGLDEGAVLARAEVMDLVERVEKLPWAKSARVRVRPAASQAVLEVSRRIPVLALADGDVWGVLPPGSFEPPGDLPLLSGIEPSQLGSRAGKKRLEQATEIMAAFEAFPGGSGSVSQIDFEADKGAVVYLRTDGTKVLLGDGQYKAKLAKLSALLSDLRSRGTGAWAIDLRYDPAVCWPRSDGAFSTAGGED